jgi:hypothetical protein
MKWKQDSGRSSALRVALWSAVGVLIVGLALPRGRSAGVGIPLALIVFLSPLWGWGFYQASLWNSRRRLGAAPPPALEIRAALAALRSLTRGLLVSILCATAWAATFPAFEPDSVHSPEGVALWLGLTLLMFAVLGITTVAVLLFQAHLLEGLAIALTKTDQEQSGDGSASD